MRATPSVVSVTNVRIRFLKLWHLTLIYFLKMKRGRWNTLPDVLFGQKQITNGFGRIWGFCHRTYDNYVTMDDFNPIIIT